MDRLSFNVYGNFKETIQTGVLLKDTFDIYIENKYGKKVGFHNKVCPVHVMKGRTTTCNSRY